jgi:hypothetical protein
MSKNGKRKKENLINHWNKRKNRLRKGKEVIKDLRKEKFFKL